MPVLLALALAVVGLLGACSDRTPPPEPPAAARTQPLAQDGTLSRAVTSVPDRARVQLDLSSVRAALRAYRAEHDTWPGSLADLNVGSLSYPADLAYDPATGTVTSRTYPTY